MRKQQWIGIDIGTQGTKGVLFNERLQPLASAFEDSKLITPAPNTVWQEAADILHSVERVIHGLMDHPQADVSAIAGIGIDSQMAGIMAVDDAFDAVTVYDSWLDTRCSPYINQMKSDAADAITRISGGPVSCTHGPKILWWKNEHPEIYRKIAKFVLPHVYVTGQFCGLTAEDAYIDHTCIHYSCFGDNLNKTWSDALLRQFDVSENRMPVIRSPFDVVGTVTETAAKACGLRSGIPMVAGAGDTAASVFGCGMLNPGTVLDCAGTASVFCGVSDDFHPDVTHQTLSMMRSPVESLWHPLAYISGGGMNIRWFVDNFGQDGHDALESEARDVPAGCDGLVFLPHWSGRVLPNDPTLKGTFFGLDWKHGRGHLYRAMMEAIAYEYMQFMDILQSLNPSLVFRQMYAIGGGSRSGLMLQIKSDALSLPMLALEMRDSSALGSATIAAHGTGAIDDYAALIEENRRIVRETKPDAGTHAFYQKGLAAYQSALEYGAQFYHGKAYQTLYKEDAAK